MPALTSRTRLSCRGCARALHPSSATLEEGEIGPDLFRHACKLGLGRNGVQAPGSLLSRRPISELDQSENPKHPAMSRVADSFA
jgi:bifunctional non-homologous end joining protein LigD